MKWIRRLDADARESAAILGAKARGLVELHRLGLPVPPGFVITTEACRAFLRERRLPDGLREELMAALGDLESATGRKLGEPPSPLALSVRSGASVSMPGMMSTILNLGLTAGDDDELIAAATKAVQLPVRTDCGRETPHNAVGKLELAVEAVFSSWETPRARTYREIHDIPNDLGTAVIVQAMVFGNRDDRSGAGVAFSRDPRTGENVPFGEVLFERQGDDVVSGRTPTLPLAELHPREPAVWTGLVDALGRIEQHYRDACYTEFTYQSGELWLLQARPGRFTGAAAVRVATDLAEENLITREQALLRVCPAHLDQVHTPRIVVSASAVILARGVGACPGVAVGKVATTSEAALRMSADGPVILVRPETSPDDVGGLAAATGIVTARGGPASHAAVVARAMGKPAVVGVAGLTVDPVTESARIAARRIGSDTMVTIDGTSGEVALGTPPVTTDTVDPHLDKLLLWADEVSGDHSDRDDTRRLIAAHAALRRDPADRSRPRSRGGGSR